jgi:hypothetical protein
VTTTVTMNPPVNITSPVFVPATTAGISLALTNGHLAAVDPTDPPSSNSSHIMNPEPSSLVLAGTALGGLAFVKWWSLRKRRLARWLLSADKLAESRTLVERSKLRCGEDHDG